MQETQKDTSGTGAHIQESDFSHLFLFAHIQRCFHQYFCILSRDQHVFVDQKFQSHKLLHELKPRTVTGVGVDLSKEALCVAEKNAEKLKIDAEFLESDLFENVKGTYDVVVSNPPYIRTSVIETLQEEVKDHDPYLALDGKEDGLYFYRRIIEQAPAYLKKKGWLLFEIGSDQGEDVKNLMEQAGYTGVSVKKDLAGLDRVVFGVYDR